MMERDSVVIIGSGLMGSGISAISALAGNKTVLVDKNMDRAQSGIKRAQDCMKELEENELAKDTEKAGHRLSGSSRLEDVLGTAKLVIEAIDERLEAKQAIFETVDAILPPDIPIASNTSGLRITDISSRTKHPERTLTTHFWFPAHLVPLVEVVMGDSTSEQVAVSVRDLLASWGKSPVLVRRDLPGQLANRVLQAVIREAVNIVSIGLASPEDVDTAIKMGMGIRLPVWGPLEHIDAVGLDLGLSVQNTVLPNISRATEANPYLSDLISKGNLGYKTGKGFYDWSVKDMDALAARRNAFIMNALKYLKKDQS